MAEVQEVYREWDETYEDWVRHVHRGDNTSRRMYIYACPACHNRVIANGEDMEFIADFDGLCEYCIFGVPRGE